MEHEDLQRLISKYSAGTASEDERRLVEDWYENIQGDQFKFTDLESRETLRDQIKSEISRHISEQDE